MADLTFDLELDATGLMCPEPVMMLHNRMAELPVEGVLRMVATDPSTQRDVPKFCQFLNHRLLQEEHTDTQFVYYIQRGA
ncbi:MULTISPECIES: sulfurtransferase TusA [Marinobacter]|uniref:sulfurtransferase TusA n=1 Tax=Marinobacter TaxID=2742 RepID=UPI000DAB3E68|nr:MULTISPECIES: sulfurtransferase TusA [Marinobacter]